MGSLIPSSNPITTYMQRWALNYLVNVSKSVNRVEVVERSYKKGLPIPLLSHDLWMFLKENTEKYKLHKLFFITNWIVATFRLVISVAIPSNIIIMIMIWAVLHNFCCSKPILKPCYIISQQCIDKAHLHLAFEKKNYGNF